MMAGIRPRPVLKAVAAVFAASVLAMAVIIGAIALYMKFYGNAHIKAALGDLLGAKVDFRSAAIDLDKQAASFRGFSVADRIGFDKDIFDADIFTIILNREKLEKEKAVVFDSVYVKGAKLTIRRDARGILNLAIPEVKAAVAEPVMGAGPGPAADAGETPPQNALYSVLRSVRDLRIEDSVIIFEDSFKMARPYTVWCNAFSAAVSARDTGSGYLSTTVTASFRLPQRQYGDGWFGVKASMAVYPDRTNMELTAGTGNIDLMVFQPYFQRNTPFFFQSGRFNSQTDFKMHDGVVDSLTTMQCANLRMTLNPHDPSAQFLHVSINRLAPYLTSGQNIVFDFVMKGDARNPQFGVGPKVKFAIGMVVMEEVGKAIQQIQRMQR